MDKMNVKDCKEQTRSYLGKFVTIKIDHTNKFVCKKDIFTHIYPVIYGYIPDVIGEDSEKLNVYLLGVNESIDEYTARIIGIIHRENDAEDKLIAVPDGLAVTREDVEKSICYQKPFYDAFIEMLDIKTYECTVQHCKFNGLPNEVVKLCENGILLYRGKQKFTLHTIEGFQNLMKRLSSGLADRNAIRMIYNNSVEIEDERGLYLAISHVCKKDKNNVTTDITFDLRITTYMDVVEINVG